VTNLIDVNENITFMDEEDKFAAFKTNYYCFKDALVTARVWKKSENFVQGGRK
jgi:hypothetical protein